MSRSLSFDSPDVEKEFPGLYMSDKRPEEVAGSKYEPEEVTEKYKLKKDFLKKDKKDKKKDKEKGYVAFEEEDSGDEKSKGEDGRSPARLKKHSKPSFKFAKKDKFPVIKKEKDDRREAKHKGEYKDKKLRVKKKSKPSESGDECKPIFGVPLRVAVARNRCYDGVELPALVRECIDYIEEHGLSCEGIYRISGVKSKVQALKDAYNKGREVKIFEHEPNVVASLLKQFLRELPEPVLTLSLMPQFEEASTLKEQAKKASEFKRLIRELPPCNRLLLAWMILHMSNVIARAGQNKMTLQNVSIVLSPTMQISHRVLNVLFHNVSTLFADTSIKRYVPPLKPATSKWSLELPDQPIAIEEELQKQESLLNQLHAEINAGMTDSEKEEQLWEVQRIVTQLKRKLKTARKSQTHRPSLTRIDDEIVLNLALATEPALKEEQPSVKEEPVVQQEDTKPVTTAAEGTTAESTSVESTITENTTAESTTAESTIAESSTAVHDDVAVQETDEADAPAKTDDCETEERTTEIDNKEDEPITEDIAEAAEADVEVAEPAIVKADEQVTAETVEKVTADEDVKTDVAVVEQKEEEAKVAEDEPDESNEDEVFDATTPVPEQFEEEEEEPARRPDFIKTDSIDSSMRELADIITPTEANPPVTTLPEGVSGVVAPSQRTAAVFRPIRDDESSFDDTETPNEDEMISGAVRPVVVPPHNLAMEFQQNEDQWYSKAPSEDSTPPLTPPVTPPSAPPRKIGWSPSLQSPLKPEILHKMKQQKAIDQTDIEEEDVDMTDDGHGSGHDDSGVDSQDEEYKSMIYQHQMTLLEEEELLAMGVELRKKIEAERDEMERLQQEIVEVRCMRDCDSDEDDLVPSSDSDRESGDEDELQAIVHQLDRDNERLERDNHELVKKIDVERQICLDVKVQIRMIQQQAERYGTGTDSLL